MRKSEKMVEVKQALFSNLCQLSIFCIFNKSNIVGQVFLDLKEQFLSYFIG